MTARYRPTPDVTAAMRSPWTPTHRQLEQLIIDVALDRDWRVHVIHDSRREHWSAISGWPDAFLVKDGRAVAIEVKVGADSRTDEQTEWGEALNLVPGIEAYELRSTGDRVADAAAIVGLLRQKPAKAAAAA